MGKKLTKKTFEPGMELEVVEATYSLGISTIPPDTKLEAWPTAPSIGIQSINKGVIIPTGAKIKTLKLVNNSGSHQVMFEWEGRPYMAYWGWFSAFTRTL